MILTLRTIRQPHYICSFDVSVPLSDLMPATSYEGVYSLSQTAHEISLICSAAAKTSAAGFLVDAAAEKQGPFYALYIEGTLDFSLTGILAGLCGALASSHIPIFALSTYDTDYLLIAVEHFDAACRCLGALDGYCLDDV